MKTLNTEFAASLNTEITCKTDGECSIVFENNFFKYKVGFAITSSEMLDAVNEFYCKSYKKGIDDGYAEAESIHTQHDDAELYEYNMGSYLNREFDDHGQGFGYADLY